MDLNDLIKATANFVENSEFNYITKENAISKNVIGLKIFDEPIFAFSSADDEYFKLLKNTSVIGEHFLLPKDWLPQSKTVISFFLPFTETVRSSNGKDKLWPSEEWLHGRIEGQDFVKKISVFLVSQLEGAGYNSLIPTMDNRFWRTPTEPKNNSLYVEDSFTSNWSERHVAFISGLGTFGLSKGIITKKGMAGRLSSIVTELYLPPTKRQYSDIYEYCSMCGSCAINCPAYAISVVDGKDNIKCSNYLKVITEKYKPRFGCGKCQVNVPCEWRIPKDI